MSMNKTVFLNSQAGMTLALLLLLLAGVAEEVSGSQLMGGSGGVSRRRPAKSIAVGEQQRRDVQLIQRGNARARGALAAWSKMTSAGSDTTALLKALKPCGVCTNYERFGEAHDGGYVLCAEHMEGVVAAHSFGVNGFDGWGAGVSTRLNGIPVHEYDCTNMKEPACPTPTGCKLVFHPTCIADSTTADRPNFKTLHELLQTNTPAPGGGAEETSGEAAAAGDLLLKVDVEGAEWGAFAEAQAADMGRFRQVVVEFHNLERSSSHGQYLKAVQGILDAGFVVVHLHGNNYGAMGQFDEGKYKVPTVLEVTFLNKAALGSEASTCETAPGLLPEDSPNNAGAPDMAGITLPALIQEQHQEQRKRR